MKKKENKNNVVAQINHFIRFYNTQFEIYLSSFFLTEIGMRLSSEHNKVK